MAPRLAEVLASLAISLISQSTTHETLSESLRHCRLLPMSQVDVLEPNPMCCLILGFEPELVIDEAA